MMFYEALTNPDRLWINGDELLVEFGGPLWVILQNDENVLKESYQMARERPTEFDNYCRAMYSRLPDGARRIYKSEMKELLLKYAMA